MPFLLNLRAVSVTRDLRALSKEKKVVPRNMSEGKKIRYDQRSEPVIRWDAVGLLKRTAVKLAVRDEAREHWGPSQVTDTSQKRHGFNYSKVTLFVPDPVSHHR
jgi:hypothetical protein